MDNVLLAGANRSGVEALRQEGVAVNSIGARDANSDYFVFRIDDRDIGRLGTDISIVYSGHGEAVAKTKDPIPHSILRLLKRLTRISFVPRQQMRTIPHVPPTDRQTEPEIEAIVKKL